MIIGTFKTNSMVYAVPLFWMIGNLSSLIMAALFISGRQQLRKTERYSAVVDCKIEQNDYLIKAKTVDISEYGFAFMLDNPEYISPDKNFDIVFDEKIGNKKYKAKLKAKIVNVIEINSKWKYSAYITEITEDDKNQWMQIVHDRVPTLPQTISNSIGLFDDLQINVKKRIEKTKNLSRRIPRVNISYETCIENMGKVSLKNFNYQYILLKFEERNDIPNNVEIDIVDNITLSCVLCEGKPDDRGVLYKVNNIDEILRNINNRDILNKWLLQKKDIFNAQKIKANKVVENLEFDPMQYI